MFACDCGGVVIAFDFQSYLQCVCGATRICACSYYGLRSRADVFANAEQWSSPSGLTAD